MDGANLGISIDHHDTLVFQNRGKVVHSTSESQFKPLVAFASEHAASLHEMLGKRFILFGEWCVLKHSLFYDKLPNHFIVFDVWDKKKGKFLSYQRVSEMVSPHGFHMVPVVADKEFKD